MSVLGFMHLPFLCLTKHHFSLFHSFFLSCLKEEESFLCHDPRPHVGLHSMNHALQWVPLASFLDSKYVCVLFP